MKRLSLLHVTALTHLQQLAPLLRADGVGELVALVEVAGVEALLLFLRVLVLDAVLRGKAVIGGCKG